MIAVISGPGGVGKGTVVRRLLENEPDLWLSRSWTTRPPRPGEDLDAYRFVDRAEFEDHIARGGFLEWAEFLDHLYGTPVPEPPSGRDVILEIDVQGARQVLDRDRQARLIFVDAPSEAEQRRRMQLRGDSADDIDRRIRRADQERAQAEALGAVRVVNEDVDETARAIAEIIATARDR